jgi:hypothetical protein
MSVRSDSSTAAPVEQLSQMALAAPLAVPGADSHVTATVDAARAADSALGDANALNTNHPDHPLRRTFVASIRATIGELCLRKTKVRSACCCEQHAQCCREQHTLC